MYCPANRSNLSLRVENFANSNQHLANDDNIEILKLLRNRRIITDKLQNGVKLDFFLYLFLIKEYRHGHDYAYAICKLPDNSK